MAVVATLVLRAMKVAEGTDRTRENDYTADQGDPRVKDLDLDHAGAPGTPADT